MVVSGYFLLLTEGSDWLQKGPVQYFLSGLQDTPIQPFPPPTLNCPVPPNPRNLLPRIPRSPKRLQTPHARILHGRPVLPQISPQPLQRVKHLLLQAQILRKVRPQKPN